MTSIHFRQATIAILLVLVLGGCQQESSGVQPSGESTPIVIGEEPVKEEATGTVVIENDVPVQEKELAEDGSDSDEKFSQDSAKGAILDEWTWERDGTLTVVNGSFENTGTVPVGFFRIRAEYVDADGKVIDQDIAVHGEVVWPGHQKMFKISKTYSENHKSVRIWIDQVNRAKEPIIQKSEGRHAEIVEGWTWTSDGPFSYISGTLRNTGERDIRYYKIMAEYSNADGVVLDSDFTNSNDILKPGQETSFRIMHPYDPEFAEVTIYISNIK